MNQFYTFLIFILSFVFIAVQSHAQCLWVSDTNDNPIVCGDGTETVNFTVVFDVDMTGAVINFTESPSGLTIPGTVNPLNSMEIIFSVTPTISSSSLCASETWTYDIDDLTSTCGAGAPALQTLSSTITVYPQQPTWQITPGSAQVCSQGMISIDILAFDGVTVCTSTMITAPQNQSCLVESNVQVDLDFEALLSITGPVSDFCWTNVSGLFSADPTTGTMFEVFPEQPQWQVQATSQEVCSQGTINIDILSADGTVCNTTMITAPQNQTCNEVTSIDVSAIDFESLLGIFGPISNTCWINPTGTVSVDDFGNTFIVYPEQPSWQITPGMNVICDGQSFSIDILAADGSVCTTTTIAAPSNTGCAIEDNVSVILDYDLLLTVTGSNGPVTTGCWTNENNTFTADPGGTAFAVLPQSLTWQVDASFSPLALCADGTNTVPVVLMGANGCLSPNPLNIPVPQNSTCMINTSYPVDISLADMETMLGLTGGELTGGQVCINPINTTMDLEPNGNLVEAHPDPNLVSWQVVPGTANTHCSGVGTIDVELTVGGVACPGSAQSFPVPVNMGCTAITSLPFTITAATIEAVFGVGTSNSCYIDIVDDVMNDPNFDLEVLPEPFIIVDAGTTLQSCSDAPNTVMVNLQAADGTVCGTPFLFDAPTNTGCGTVNTFSGTVTVGDIETALMLTPGNASLCYTDLNFTESIFPGTFEVFPAAPTGVSVTVLSTVICSEDSDVLSVDLIAADGSICTAGILVDAQTNNTCMAQTSIDFTVAVADIETALNVPPGLCTNYVDIMHSELVTVNPAPPDRYELAGAVPGAVCSGSMTPVTVNIIGADGTTICDFVEITIPINDGCEPLLQNSLSFTYGRPDWANASGGTNPCGFGGFSDSYLVDIYPEPFTLDSSGGGACMDLVADLVAANGLTCYNQMFTCAGDTDVMNFDFNDPAAAMLYGDLIPWNVNLWPAPCNPGNIFTGMMECLNCPEICSFSGAYPYWTSYCPDAHILCDPSAIAIQSCTPPTSVENDDCEPEGNLCNGASTADNMSWFAFIAGSVIIDINVSLINCISGNPSFQAGVWDECICNGGACLSGQSSPCGTNIDILVTNAVIGETYYIFVDGCAGSQCNFVITINQAPPFEWECPVVPEVNNCQISDITYPPNSYCVDPGGTLELFVEMPQYDDFIGTLNSVFTWSIVSPNGIDPIPFDMGNPLTGNDPFVNLEISADEAGPYSICFEGADNDCDDTSDCSPIPQCFDFNVVVLPDQDWGVHDVCYDILEQEGYFPPPQNGWFWQGPPIFTWDLDPFGMYSFTAINECGCAFEQVIEINILDFLDPIPYTIYLCEDDPDVIFPSIYGPVSFGINDAFNDLFWLPDLAPNGCDLPVYLSVLGLIVDGELDTLSASCNSIELDWSITETVPYDLDRDDIQFIWTNDVGDTLTMESNYLFTTEGNYTLEVTYWTFNEFSEYKECKDFYDYVVNFEELVIAPPTFIDPVLTLCPGVVQTIDYALFDRMDNNTWTSQPPGLIANISGSNNTVATVNWDGISGGRLCAIADNTCDGVPAVSEERCIDIIVTPAQNYSITVQDTICELLDSVAVSFIGDVEALDSIVWSNGDSTEMVYYDLTASDAYQLFDVYVVDTFGCIFPVVTDSVYVDAENFLTISIPEPKVCINTPDDADFTVAVTGPGFFTPMAGLDVVTGVFDPEAVGEGMYTFEYVGKPTEGCVADTVRTSVEIIETPQPAFTLPTSICLGEIASIAVAEMDTIGGVEFEWLTPNATSNYSGDNTAFDLTYTNIGTFDVSLIVNKDICFSDTLTQSVEVRDTLTFAPFSCVGQGTDFIDFEWTVPSGVTNFDVTWTINGSPAGSVSGPDNTLNVPGLNEDDEVVVTVVATDPNSCGDKTQIASCVALNCPEPGLFMDIPEDICLDPNGGTPSISLVPMWAGPDPAPAMGDGGPVGFDGVGVDPVSGEFTPTTAGTFDITYTYKNDIGCTFFATVPVTVLDPPSAALVSADTICLGDQLTLQFNGNTVGVDFTWDFDNEIFNNQSDMNNSNITLEWDTPGTKNITVNTLLNTTTTLCEANAAKEVVVLDTMTFPVFEPCGDAGLDFVTFSWGDVMSANDNIPADGYMVSLDGVPLGIQDTTSLLVTGLGEAQTVIITVTALDPNGCGDKTSEFECTTLFCRHDYVLPLSPAAFICSNRDTMPFTIVPDLSLIPVNELGSGVFTIDPANGMIDDQGTFDPKGLAAGVYTVEYVYTNVIGCIDPFYVDITIYDEPSATFAMPPAVCIGDPIRVLYSGDATDVTFTWDIGSGISPDLMADDQSTVYDISWDNAGIQTITLTTERNGCINTTTETIEVVGPADITLIGPNGPTCFDQNGIQLEAIVMTQTGNFNGFWQDPNVDANGFFFPPMSGNFTYSLVYQVNEGSCTTTDTLEVEVLASPSVTVDVDEMICVDNMATVQATASNFATITWDLDGGTLVSGDDSTEGPLTIMWDTPGNYTLSATVENGICVATNTDDVIVEPRINPLNISCDEEITSITFSWTPVNCSSSYNLIVDGNLVESGYTGTSYTVINLDEQQTVDFSVTTISDCECPGFENAVQCISDPCPIYSVDFSTDRIGYCFGESVNVDLNPVQTPAVGPDGLVTWTGPGVNQNGQFSSDGLSPGEYELIYSYTEGICGFTDTVVVQVSDLPQITTNTEDPICYLDRFGIVFPEIVSGFGPFSGTVTGGPNFTGQWDGTTPIEDVPPGTYQMLVTDVNGCTNIVNFEINDVIEPSVEIDGADIQTVGEPENYTFQVEPDNIGINFDSIVWTLNDIVYCSGLECLDIQLDEQEDSLDTLCIQLFYNMGCFIESCKPVRIREIKQFYIPNIFSPNNDQNNDDLRFYTNNENAIVHDVSIYDRWGNLVFTADLDEIVGTQEEKDDNDPAKNDVFLWDGLFGDREVQPGVYVYKVNYTLDPVNGGRPEVVAGDITVMR